MMRLDTYLAVKDLAPAVHRAAGTGRVGRFRGGDGVLQETYRAVLPAFVAIATAWPAVAQDVSVPLQAQRIRELVHLVRQDCGSCHGLTLQGGLGPALTPPALRDKPRDSLVATILGGRPGTPMPPFRGIVAEDEAAWIVDRLFEGFPGDPGASH